MRKPAFCICENKDADQPRGNREADQRLCFRYMYSSIPLLSKSEISSLLPSSMAVQPDLCRTWSDTRKTGFLTTRLFWFYERDLHFDCLSSCSFLFYLKILKPIVISMNDFHVVVVLTINLFTLVISQLHKNVKSLFTLLRANIYWATTIPDHTLNQVFCRIQVKL